MFRLDSGADLTSRLDWTTVTVSLRTAWTLAETGELDAGTR